MNSACRRRWYIRPMRLGEKIHSTVGLLGFLAVVIAVVAGLVLWQQRQDTCGPFPDWHSSPFVLPYPVGQAYRVSQGNCSHGGHSGPYKYAYDFVMPLGTTI